MVDLRAYDPDDRPVRVQANSRGELIIDGQEKTIMVHTVPVNVPGKATNAHAAEDVIGDSIVISVPDDGIILSALGVDNDDESIEYNIFVFNEPFTATADDTTFVLVAEDVPKLLGVINVNSFVGTSGVTIGTENNINMPYHTDLGNLYCQLVTTGAPNYAAGKELLISFGLWARVRESD